MKIEELLAREEIRDTIVNYSISGDLGDSTAFESFHPDGAIETSNGTIYKSREKIVELFNKIRADRKEASPDGFSRHWVNTYKFDFPSPDEANTITYMVNYSENGFEQVVTYYDNLLRVDGTWLIFHRRIGMEYVSPGSRFQLGNSKVVSRQSS